MSEKSNKSSNYLDELIDKWSGFRKVSATYFYSTNPKSLEGPGDLSSIICIGNEHLSEVAAKSLKVLEEEENFSSYWTDLKWKLLAYTTVQDLFSGPVLESSNNIFLFRQWYFYYEAKYLLIEAILSGLNGFTASIGLLLRLFIEFSLLQNYSYLKIQKTGSYSVIESYFQKQYNPNWSTIIKGCLPPDNFCKPIRKRLTVHLDGLSKSCAHPYHPLHSPKHSGSFLPEQTLEGLFFAYKISLMLEAVLWVYFINFPMLFHPVDIQKKFGFNYPVGLFIDETGAEIIRRSVSEADYKHFYDFSKNTELYNDLMSFYNSRPDMTDGEVKKTWDVENNGDLKDLISGHCMVMSKLRVIAETMALGPRDEATPEINKLADQLSFDKWRKFYKNIK